MRSPELIRLSQLVDAVWTRAKNGPCWQVRAITDHQIVLSRVGEPGLYFRIDPTGVTVVDHRWGRLPSTTDIILRLGTAFECEGRTFTSASDFADYLLNFFQGHLSKRSPDIELPTTLPITEFLRQFFSAELGSDIERRVDEMSHADLITLGRYWTEYQTAYHSDGIPILRAHQPCFSAVPHSLYLGPQEHHLKPSEIVSAYDPIATRRIAQHLLVYPRVLVSDSGSGCFLYLSSASKASAVLTTRKMVKRLIRFYSAMAPWIDDGSLVLVPDLHFVLDSADLKDSSVILSSDDINYWAQAYYPHPLMYDLDAIDVRAAKAYLRERGTSAKRVNTIIEDVAGVLDMANYVGGDPTFWTRAQTEIYRWTLLKNSQTQPNRHFLETIAPPQLDIVWLPDLSRVPIKELLALHQDEDLFDLWRTGFRSAVSSLDHLNGDPERMLKDLSVDVKDALRPTADRLRERLNASSLGTVIGKQTREFAVTGAAVYVVAQQLTAAIGVAGAKALINVLMGSRAAKPGTEGELAFLSVFSFFEEIATSK